MRQSGGQAWRWSSLLKNLKELPKSIVLGTNQSSLAQHQPHVPKLEDAPAIPILGQSASVPPGQLVVAFSDVHGQFDLLTKMLRRIEAEAASDAGLKAHIVGLGDYIDRGPESARVLDLLVGLSRDKSLIFTALKGNHEDVLLRFLEKPQEIGPLWMKLGGEETLRSYGLELPRRIAPADFVAIREDLAHRLPAAHLGLLLGLRTRLTIGDYFFCHAGVRSGIPLDEQKEQDLMWLRKGFAEGNERLEKTIIHGHRPVVTPEIRPYRVNIDTGAYLTGVLSCAVLEGSRLRIIQVRHSSGSKPDANPHQKIEP